MNQTPAQRRALHDFVERRRDQQIVPDIRIELACMVAFAIVLLVVAASCSGGSP